MSDTNKYDFVLIHENLYTKLFKILIYNKFNNDI